MKNFLYPFLFAFSLQLTFAQTKFPNLEYSKNSLDYRGFPSKGEDRTSLAFSDKGSWFAFGFLNSDKVEGGFAGPLLLTEQNGVWLSSSFASLHLIENDQKNEVDWKKSLIKQTSYNSHLQQDLETENLKIVQKLVFLSGNSALQQTTVTNISNKVIQLSPYFSSHMYLNNISLSSEKNGIKLTSTKGNGVGYLLFLSDKVTNKISKTSYTTSFEPIHLNPKESHEITISQSFIFPQYSWKKEHDLLLKSKFDTILKNTQAEKELQLKKLLVNTKSIYSDTIYANLAAKLVLTLQNNSRIAAEGLRHDGLFPSYHYEWFNGFWAWDSWKHAAAVVNYNPELAKNQIRAMFDYQEPNGFIPDCIYRDTLIEPNNYRNTKSPLAAWAVWKIHEKIKDKNFLKEFYPKLKKYHQWWYIDRDHDQDGLCEFGATDGSLIAAKWESGMDNAVRFDNSQLLENGPNAFSLDNESVDLNSFLYAEKIILSKIALVLNNEKEAADYKKEASNLKEKIQTQFWDETTSWFYDTTLDGKIVLKVMGCEGFFPLWSNAATVIQAEKVKNNMMNPAIFNTWMPLPTLAANHPKFKPQAGYWRGPIWLDQVYFGITGLTNYGFDKEAQELAYKTIHNAEGVLDKGSAIRENYQPITGKGLEAYNFSWSAAHYLLLLLKN